MRFRYFYLLIPMLWFGCSDSSDSDDVGNWIKKSDFEGVTRSGAVSFTIGDYAYVGLGSDGDDYLLDFWRYDPSINYWEKMADFPGDGRTGSVAFSVDGKGYVGTGYNAELDDEELADFWEYDPEANAWTQKTDFPGGARYAAVGFSVGGEGYIGTGYDGNYLKDFWKYNPTTETWEAVVSLYGGKRESAVAFVIDDKAYVASGKNNSKYLYDFFEYDPETGVWTDLTLYDEDDTYDIYITAITRYSGVAFTVDGLGYIGTGVADSYTSSIYSYDPLTNEWSDEVTAFEGSSRALAVSFVVNNTAYVALGRNSGERFDDIYEFDPYAEYEEYD